MPSKDPVKVRAAQTRYRVKHREAINARKRAAHAANPARGNERARRYRKENAATVRQANRQWRHQFWPALRAEFIAAYGGRCACCSESEPKFLDLDHVNGNGAKHRRELGNNQQVILFLKRSGWPKQGYQLLCCNCNQGRARNGGICPHKQV